MPSELLTALPQLGALVEKLGVIGLLLAVAGWLIYDRLRMMKELRATYRDRDKARLISERFRAALSSADLTIPDTADIELQFQVEAS